MKYGIFPFLQIKKLKHRGLHNLPQLHSWLEPDLGFKPRQPDSRLKSVLLTTRPYNKSHTWRTTVLRITVFHTFLRCKIFEHRPSWNLLLSTIYTIQALRWHTENTT